MYLTEEEPVREQLEKIAMEEEKSAKEGEIIVIPDVIEDNTEKSTEKAMEVQLIKEMENHPPSPMMMVGVLIYWDWMGWGVNTFCSCFFVI